MKDRTGAEGFNSHHYSGSLSIFEIPDEQLLTELSALVARNMRKSGSNKPCNRLERTSLREPSHNELANPV